MDRLTTPLDREPHAGASASAAPFPGTAAGVARVLFPMLPPCPDLAAAARRDPAPDVAPASGVAPSRA